MNIKLLRDGTGMSQRQFSAKFGIPLGTLRNWEQGISQPPEYVYQMIMSRKDRDVMINIETLELLFLTDELQQLLIEGVDDFAEATSQNFKTKLFYDSSSQEEDNQYNIVRDAMLIEDPECYHHDIISCYGSESEEYNVFLVLEDPLDPYIIVDLFQAEKLIIIEKGRKYMTD